MRSRIRNLTRRLVSLIKISVDLLITLKQVMSSQPRDHLQADKNTYLLPLILSSCVTLRSCSNSSSVGSEVFTAVTMKNAVLWDVAPCRYCEMNRCFGESYRHHLQGSRWLAGAHAGSSLADFSTLKMKAIRSSETSVHFTGSIRRHISEDGILHNSSLFKAEWIILCNSWITP
jgi:hypothetical protein